ncbi:hypothetical protein [Haloprofundus salinisoli]|nr:hypothetical protein [Haloprofundus salinisoli]
MSRHKVSCAEKVTGKRACGGDVTALRSVALASRRSPGVRRLTNPELG